MQASWIWPPQEDRRPHQYVCFRKAFTLRTRPRRATIDISADSDFVLCLNGREAGRGQFSDYPRRKTWTRFHVGRLLRRGQNLIAVLAYYRGEDFAEHRAGAPGLIAALKAGERVVVTDSSWRAMEHPAFRPGPMPRVTWQMGFTTCFDARKDIAWHSPALRDTEWPGAEVTAGATDGFRKELLPRPVAPLRLEDPVRPSIVMQGTFHRTGEGESVAETMAGDALVAQRPVEVFSNPELAPAGDYSGPPGEPAALRLALRPPDEGTSGRFFVVDLGREEVGLLALSLEASSGTVVDIAHGEHLDDGRVRAWIGGRNFADRYICREGENCFTLPFRRLGCRYLEVHVSSYRHPVEVDYVSVRPTVLPVERIGRFEANDPLANRTYATAVRTLELCMHEHYEDCPWREQSLYAYDSRNQALYGYYAFGNYGFAAASFDLLGRGVRQDGQLELCAPARVRWTIPIFSLVWITALAEHWLFSGEPTLFNRFAEQVRWMLEQALARRDERTGLYRTPTAGDTWDFCEWTPGLAGSMGGQGEPRQVEASYNLYLHEALGSYARMASAQEQIAPVRRALGAAIHRHFWDERAGAYATRLLPGRRRDYHDHIQVLALHQGIAPRTKERRVRAALCSRRLPAMTLSSLVYMVRALMDKDAEARGFVSSTLSRYWDPMVLAGATSFWETQYGSDDFHYAGSLCHGWSALPVFYYQAHVLGVQPLEPGFRRFALAPYPDRFFRAEGSVPTPSGSVRIAWERSASGLRLVAEGPTELTPELRPLPEAPVAEATYNGRAIPPR